MFDGLIFNLRKLIKKPLKVALIAKNYFSKTGCNGTAVHSYRISQGLAKLGCEVHVFTKGEKNLKRHKYFEKGVVVVHEIAIKSPIQKMDSLSEHRFHHALFELAVLPKLMEENEISNFDILHSQGGGGSAALISKYFSGIPWIHTFHGLEKKRVKMLSEEGKLITIGKNIILKDLFDNCKDNLLDFFQTHEFMQIDDFRKMTGANRNFAVALLEKFDALGITGRTDDGRKRL